MSRHVRELVVAFILTWMLGAAVFAAVQHLWHIGAGLVVCAIMFFVFERDRMNKSGARSLEKARPRSRAAGADTLGGGLFHIATVSFLSPARRFSIATVSRYSRCVPFSR